MVFGTTPVPAVKREAGNAAAERREIVPPPEQRGQKGGPGLREFLLALLPRV